MNNVPIRFLMYHINEATPGGIRREQFVHRPHPIKALLAMFPVLAFVAACVVLAVTHAR